MEDRVIDDLVTAAEQGDWKFVDAALPAAVMDPRIVEWAYHKGLDDSRGDVRDLAASALALARIPRQTFVDNVMPKLARNLEDSHPYARFRAACALAAHEVDGYAGKVKAVLKSFENDSDVSEIAKRYLARLR